MLSCEARLERKEDVLPKAAQHLPSEVLVATLFHSSEVVLLLVSVLDLTNPLTNVLRRPRMWICV